MISVLGVSTMYSSLSFIFHWPLFFQLLLIVFWLNYLIVSLDDIWELYVWIHFMYADVLILLSITRRDLQCMIDNCCLKFDTIRMTINSLNSS